MFPVDKDDFMYGIVVESPARTNITACLEELDRRSRRQNVTTMVWRRSCNGNPYFGAILNTVRDIVWFSFLIQSKIFVLMMLVLLFQKEAERELVLSMSNCITLRPA
jgi:hypothetical protein